MKISDKVRRAYELRPYPFGSSKALTASTWSLDLRWVGAIGAVGSKDYSPNRILVAGCGDGTEAFSLQRRLPRSEIVAVDFSARSIGIARRLQRRMPEMHGIRFVESDLSDRRLPARLGEFDLITCHGVLSYVAAPVPVLRNLGKCLKPEGLLYTGVNGADHVSKRLRPALERFGYDLDEYPGGRRLQSLMELCDIVLGACSMTRVSGHSASYLAGDVFGPLNRGLSMAGWIAEARRAGLHFRGNIASAPLFRKIADNGSHPNLIPWSRARVCEFLELLGPSPFHRLLFSRNPESNPPWEHRAMLLRCRILLTRLYDIRLPKPGKKVLDRLRRLRITSVSSNVAMEWRMPEWEMELLRCASGDHSLAALLRLCPLSVPFDELRRQLYLLYQLGVINLLPPRGGK
jgi:SAM-dependent methyltransferase